jgi:hypothetical protein
MKKRAKADSEIEKGIGKETTAIERVIESENLMLEE